MRPEVGFPINTWIKVTGIRLYGNTDDNVNTALDICEAQYGRRIRDYLQMLSLAVGYERGSSTELMPPFKGEKNGGIDSNEYKYAVSGHNLFVEDDIRGRITVKVKEKKKGFLGLPRTETITLAEIEYREMRKE